MKNKPDPKTSSSSGEQAILNAAEVLFAQKGFDAVSMSAIAKLANTSKPNIYHHFKNKNELYLAVMKAAVRRSSALLDTLEHAPGTFILINPVGMVFQMDRFHRANVGTLAALVAEVNPIIAGRRETPFDLQRCHCRIDFPEILQAAG